MFMVKSRILATVGICCLLTTSAWANHAKLKNQVPLPFFVSDENPLSTLTITGVSVNMVQGFPTFHNGEEKVKGSVQYSNKDALFLGMHLWKGATVVFNPEMYYGYNPSNNIGVASSVNVATARVESKSPYLQVQRLFLQQVIDLGGNKTKVNNQGGRSQALEALTNQINEETTDHNLTLTIGKFGVGDIFDDNIYSHDPTRHFMNTSFNGMENIDYAGNAWGTTFGAAAEWQKDWWTLRAGIFQGSDLPPSLNLEPVALKSYMLIGEAEARYNIFEQPGNIKLLGYQDHGYINMIGEYNGSASVYDALPFFAKERMQRHTKLGIGINLQQQITDGVGMFIRAGMDNKTYDFNDITQGINGGFVFFGKLWGRELDEIGIAAGYNSMTGGKSYKNGMFTQIGAGAFKFAPESVFETYYKFVPWKGMEITADYQFVQNPNFLKNSDTAHVFGFRARINF